MKESRNSKRILIAAGGTGGHIIPAISIAKEFIKKNHAVLFIGNKNSMEEESCKRVSIPFKGIDVQKFYRKFTFAHYKFPFKLIKSVITSKKIINEFKPDAFMGTGGFVSGPVGYAAHLKKIPIFLQEQNSFPGATTRILSKYAEKIFLGNECAEKYLSKGKTILSGNPINSNVIEEKSQIDFKKFGLKKESIKLFLLGGSQGSLVLNKALYPIINDLISSNIEIIWQIGKFSYKEFSKKIKNKSGIYAFDFSDEIGKIYNSVDFCIARAGALTLAELETKKIPSILIPLPSAAENHQYYNALELKNKKVAEIIQQKDLNPEVLKNEIFEMMGKYLEMRENFGESKHLDSAKIIAEEIQKILGD
ncbi:MAG: undecaprenyldiphospho-muramoylpentapeptide beta-N-acetylglucosaminyltransferase [Armatimonadetes bacterium]|nr:undecaprenyldiphospho-muramoylpentapeptide beta-N-acetylglucosaminyltransferase [Armatimonadota bacterium]